MRLGGSHNFDFTADDVAFIAAPPPGSMSSGRSMSSDLFSPTLSPTKVVSPKAVQQQVLQKPSSPARREITVEDILADLESSEAHLYGEAFSKFPGGASGSVGLDTLAMRDFLCTNSTISMETIDMELLIISSPDEGLPASGFLHLLREFPVSDADSIAQWLELTSNSDIIETLSSEECRTALLIFGQQKIAGSFTSERWEQILDTIMWDAGMTVSMEQWMCYCKLIGRILRLLRYTQVRKLGVGEQRKSGMVGGA
jgi:hypothetical protein